MSVQSDTIPPIILPEILGFSPHLLLDDIIDIANDAIRHTVDAMEEFITRWTEDRAKTEAGEWDGKAESEMGIIALQTLLESHTDLAFDAFEAWSLRNIFAFEAGLPLVVPHQAGLNLREPEGSELALMKEIEELHRKVVVQRRLKRMFTQAIRKSAIQRRQCEERLARLSTFSALQPLADTCERSKHLHQMASTLPPPDPELYQLLLQDPGRRQWEVSRAGYLNWAVDKLMTRANAEDVGPREKDIRLNRDSATLKAAWETLRAQKQNEQ